MKVRIKKLGMSLFEGIHERRKLVLALSCLVVFITTYVLILPGFTLDKDEAAAQGGIDVPAAAEAESGEAGANADKAVSDDGLVFAGEKYSVAIADKHNKLSGTTKVEVSEISKDDKKQAKQYEDLYADALKAVQEAEGGEKVAVFGFAKFYDISLMDGKEEVEPSKAVDVTISFDKALQKELKAADPADVHVIHFAEDKKTGEVTAEVLDSKKTEITVDDNKMTEAAFEADSFSIYGIASAEESEEAAEEVTEPEEAGDTDADKPQDEETGETEGSEETGTDAEVTKVRAMPRPKAVKNDAGDELEHHKTLTPNVAENGEWDGTYTLSLDIVGKQISEQTTSASKADIILVLDMSSSMIDNSVGGSTRFEIERDAVKTFGSALLAKNADEPDTIRMSVMTFGNMGNDPVISGETSPSAFENAVANLEPPHSGVGGLTSGGQATNWEDALTKANNISMRSDAKKIVIFVSDGQPTLRNTPDNPHAMEAFMYRQIGAYGPGTDTPSGWWTDPDILESVVQKCYNNAKDEAKAIVDSDKDFYAITVFENVSRMENLVAYAYSGNDSGSYPDGHYKTANNASELANVFWGLVETASSALKYENVTITDTLTVATKSSLQVSGHANDFKYYKNGEEWEGAPEASYNNGTVEWDLGPDALDNDTTYTVSFTVWPNQDAYDAIMKLNNGDATEADIERDYPDVYANLKKEGDKYVIYSNGDATVTYDKVTYENDTETSRTPGELSYSRPTMETLEYKMKVAKIWKDSLYADNRPENITFNILEDGQPYKTVTLTSASASASDPNRWEAEIPISPGIISDKIIDGVRLNGGHEYTVVEAEDSDYHYDFDPEVLIPMLDNGTMHFLGDEDGDEALSGTNHMRGSMTITKKVIDEDGNDISSAADVSDKDFTFKVSLLTPVEDGYEEITGKTASDDDAVWYRLLDDQGDEIGRASVINSGDTFTLKPGHSLRLLNLPRGLKYKVEEVTASNPNGFEFDSEEYDSVSETNENTVELTPDAEGYCIAQPNSWQYVTITNKKIEKPVGSIKITKNVTVDGKTTTGDTADGDYYFTITDEDGNPAAGKVGDTNITDGTVKTTVTHGASSEVTVTDVPAGTYTISEAETNNGTVLSKIDNIDVSATSSKEITVEKDKTAEISFTNDRSSTVIEESTDVTVVKKWLDKDGNELDSSDTANKNIKYRITQKRAVVNGSKAIYPVVLRMINYDGSVHSTKTYYLEQGNYPDIAAFKKDTNAVQATATKYSGKITKKQTKDADINGENKRYYFNGLGSIAQETLIDIKPASPSVEWDHPRLRSTYKADSPENYIKELDKTGLEYQDNAQAEVELSATEETVYFTLDGVTYSADNNNFRAAISNLPLYKRVGNDFYVYKYEVTEVEADGEAVTDAGDGTASSENYTVTYDRSADGKTTTISNKSNETVPEAEITIKKVDKANGDPLTGATFVLVAVDENGVPYVKDGGLDPDHYNSGILEVDANGVITFSHLKPGNYLLSEYDTPNGYARIGGGTWYVTVDAEGNAALAESMTGNSGISIEQGATNTFIVQNEKLDNYDPNPPKPDLEHHKKIDALRDGTQNPDTTLDTTATADELTDLYRIYLDYTINSLQEPNGVDLLFVIDHSGSMNNTAYGGNAARAPAVMNVLNGPNGNDGIIKDFLDMNEHNTWAAVGFKGDSGINYYFRPNHRAENAGRNHSEDLSNGWKNTTSSVLLPNEGYAILTNYTAGFWRAEQMLFQNSIKNDGKKKVIIFISDGIPTLHIPGLGGTLANAGTADGSRYYADSQGGCMPQALEQFGYFVNDMTANGYTFGDNAEMYAIGFGDSILASEEGQQLLKDMLSTAYGENKDENFVGINDPRTGYDPTEKLEKALSIIIGKTESFDHVKVEDTLSDYVELYGAAGTTGDLSSSSAKVTMKPNPNTPTDPDSELVLYENGVVTEAGRSIIKGVSVNNKTVSTEFVDDYKAQLGYTYTLSFDVRVTDEAYKAFADADNKYDEQGDLDTDYGTNKTSSGKSGFFSNAEGKITYTHNDDETPTVEEYEKPVIQIFNAPIKILKVDQSMQPVGGAKFNLYSSEYDPDKSIEENAGCLLKTDCISTIKDLPGGGKEAEVTTDKLKHGTYWLVETDAPDNYFDLDGPIRIDVSVVSSEEAGDTVNVKAYMNGVEIKNPYLVSAAGSDQWVLKVENKQGYELPNAGGIGTTMFYLLGSLLVIGSAVFLVARRRISSDN